MNVARVVEPNELFANFAKKERPSAGDNMHCSFYFKLGGCAKSVSRKFTEIDELCGKLPPPPPDAQYMLCGVGKMFGYTPLIPKLVVTDITAERAATLMEKHSDTMVGFVKTALMCPGDFNFKAMEGPKPAKGKAKAKPSVGAFERVAFRARRKHYAKSKAMGNHYANSKDIPAWQRGAFARSFSELAKFVAPPTTDSFFDPDVHSAPACIEEASSDSD